MPLDNSLFQLLSLLAQALEEAGFIPHFIEVLNFKFVNSVQLAEQLQRHEEYSGMVVTSQTVVNAIEKAIAEGYSNVTQCF